VEVSLRPRRLRFIQPVRTAYGRLAERELIELELRQDGLRGRGEAAPLEPYDGVSLTGARAALEAYRPLLAGAEDQPQAELLAACRALADLPQALAAVDVALWELKAQRARLPVAALLSDHPAPSVALSAALDAGEPAAVADAAAQAARQGFRCVKLKVGTGEDVARALAVRAALGPELALRLDANGAWSPEQAPAALDALRPADPELIEEPVHGLAALRELRARTQLSLAIDETAADPTAIRAGVADAVCLKLSRCGGITGLLEAAGAARAAGSRVYLGSTYDGPIGIAATLHAAAALAPEHACGLATLDLFDGLERLPVSDGEMAVPPHPGLGV
jgi:o-succinylbenzoate synthase